MRAKLKRLHSPDIDLDTFEPINPNEFSFLLQAMIGPENQEGADSFDFVVCTPEWIRARREEYDLTFGRHLLIVFEFDVSKIKNRIAKYCEQCIGNSWPELANKLSRIGKWEFEDYVPH